MSKRPQLNLDVIAAKSEIAHATKSDASLSTKRDIVEAIPSASAPTPKAVLPTLPKVTLYAHTDVLKAVRRLAVDDGVQAQAILRDALRDYLAKRGHHFTDLTTGK